MKNTSEFKDSRGALRLTRSDGMEVAAIYFTVSGNWCVEQDSVDPDITSEELRIIADTLDALNKQ